ncbi:MAG: rRNA maturation RNase YbeY [Acidimicrobiales bacterium]
MVFAADEQSAHPVDLERWRDLAVAVLDAEGLRGEVEVSLLFLDSEAMADLNRRFLDRSGPTDVLAFPIDDEPAEGGRSPDAGGTGPGWMPADPEGLPRLLGDVVICPEVAHRNALAGGGSLDDEIALLVVHGLLHLNGMDHELEPEATQMEARERELLAGFYRPAPGPDTPATPQTPQIPQSADQPGTRESR